MSASLLTLESVACVRGGRLLFEQVTLSLRAGEALTVVGPNGTGKSSLLRVAAGLLRQAAGTIERSGPVALADEHHALDERLPLGQALCFWSRLDRADPSAAMAMMGLERLAQVPVRMLSTGQRKRATIARVIATSAPLWLLDEPANGLDSEGIARLSEAMAAHRVAGGAILAASHQPFGLDAPSLMLAQA